VRRNLLRHPPRRLSLVGLGLAAAIVLAACVPTSPPPPPPGVYQGAGFDVCGLPSVQIMDEWTYSPYHSVGIYMGGINAACKNELDGTLTASWVSQVTAVGWHLAPIYVGLQAPCYSGGTDMSYDPLTAWEQGVGSADDAVSEAAAIGLGPSTPIYYDMESYGACSAWGSAGSNAVMEFVMGWDLELHNHGYVAGYYSSLSTGIADQVTNVEAGFPYAPVPDDIWFAAWPGEGATVSDTSIPADFWGNHQRLHQDNPGTGSVNQSWGGSPTLNIDLDYDDGQLVG
jgi:hypothetical protein